ncbi:MAG: Gfo/Idh/MocA family oxidoreductase [Chloroflexi bacterium]|nr:Gfo/Idh/MocA family oxidoreductase [Chloroflexota bacterium]
MHSAKRGHATKVGVVGVGYWGPKIVRNLSEMPEADLRWVVDLDAGRLARVRAQYPAVRTTHSYADVLRSDVEAVVVATPIRTHHALAKAALLAGKHVMVEKPLTSSSAEATDLVRVAEERGLVLMVGHTFEYNPAVRVLRDIVASGEIGEVFYVDMARLNLGLFQSDINVLWDLAPHDLSILLYVLQRDPIAVSARGSAIVTPGVHDLAYVEVRFADGILAHVHVTWLDPCKVRRVTVVGSRKMVVYDDVQEVEKIRIYDKGVDRPYETDHFTDFPLTYRYGGVNIPHIPLHEPLRAQCEHFLNCVRTGERPQSDGRVGLKVVRILEQADKSLQNGGVREPALFDVPRTDGVGPHSLPAGHIGAAVLAAEGWRGR